MQWRLKDQLLQERLDSFSNGKFSKELEECADDIHSECIVIELDKYGDVELSVFVRLPALEKIPEYNPNDWNEYPKVTPSENIPMRVETESGGYIYRECAIFNEGVWKCERDGNADEELYGHVKRFRPWED